MQFRGGRILGLFPSTLPTRTGRGRRASTPPRRCGRACWRGRRRPCCGRSSSASREPKSEAGRGWSPSRRGRAPNERRGSEACGCRSPHAWRSAQSALHAAQVLPGGEREVPAEVPCRGETLDVADEGDSPRWRRGHARLLTSRSLEDAARPVQACSTAGASTRLRRAAAEFNMHLTSGRRPRNHFLAGDPGVGRTKRAR